MAERDLQELDLLLEQLCEDRLDEQAGQRLVELLDGSPACRRRYLDTLELHAALWTTGGEGLRASRTTAEAGDGLAVEGPEPFVPPIVLDYSSALQPSASLFSPGGSLFSYAAAMLIVGIAILGAWTLKITHYGQTADTRPGPTIERPQLVFVGRITGMDGCRWADPDTQTYIGSSVPLGRRYALSAGLMEITYLTGARVILEGPCTYKVDSDAGGYMSLGKLTARVEKSEEGRGKGEERRLSVSAASAKPQAANQNSPSSFILHPSSLFFVRTPTAVVTDLGTEFGVEVNTNGDTTSYVFQGKIMVKAGIRGFKDSGVQGSAKRPATAVAREAAEHVVALGPGESVFVSMVHETHQDSTTTQTMRFTHPTTTPKFVRRLYEPPKLHEYAKTVLADGPLFYWTFDEPFGPAIEQVRGLPHQRLQPFGGARRYDHAFSGSGLALGRAADFNEAPGVFASSELRQGHAMPGAWAVEFWVQVTGEHSTDTGQYLLNAGIGGSPPYYRDNPAVRFNWPHDAERHELQLFYPLGGPTHGGPALADNRWRHVIFVFFGSEASYGSFGVAPRVDVMLDGQGKTINRGDFSSAFSLEGKLYLGAAGMDLSAAFHGRIDELAVYDLSELTMAQIESRAAGMARRHFDAARAAPPNNRKEQPPTDK